jgi:hypothetical protein
MIQGQTDERQTAEFLPSSFGAYRTHTHVELIILEESELRLSGK